MVPLAFSFPLCYTAACAQGVSTDGRSIAAFETPCRCSDEQRLQTRRRKTRETPPENLRDPIRGISTDGSARHSHCRGQGFDSPMLHKNWQGLTSCHIFVGFGLPHFLPEDNAKHWRGERICCFSKTGVYKSCVIRQNSSANSYEYVLLLIQAGYISQTRNHLTDTII